VGTKNGKYRSGDPYQESIPITANKGLTCKRKERDGGTEQVETHNLAAVMLKGSANSKYKNINATGEDACRAFHVDAADAVGEARRGLGGGPPREKTLEGGRTN